MRYLSLFSGIEAATMAWKDFGWECVGVSEIDAFACELLQQRHPTIPNLGDITQITKEQLDALGTVDIVVGGSPCQSFSTAGNKGGLEDPRGKLMYDYIQVVRTVRPKWFVWENVPGVLSMDGGRAFGTLLREMADIGYSLCWRVLNAQHFGVCQHRRRVFIVGHIGTDGECAAKVLFDPESRSRNTGTSKAPKQNITSRTSPGSGKFSKPYTKTGFAQYKYGFGTLMATDYKRPEKHLSMSSGIIRRLTPVEYERLQGFPDNYTKINWRGKSANDCPDGHRYRSLGNSMAVPVMKWIGHNIKIYDERYYLPW
jgi:DNA (cytosine-5)-methyltransferase 1